MNSELLRLNNNSGAHEVSDWVGYRAHSEGHKDSRIGGTGREIRRDAARRDRRQQKNQPFELRAEIAKASKGFGQ